MGYVSSLEDNNVLVGVNVFSQTFLKPYADCMTNSMLPAKTEFLSGLWVFFRAMHLWYFIPIHVFTIWRLVYDYTLMYSIYCTVPGYQHLPFVTFLTTQMEVTNNPCLRSRIKLKTSNFGVTVPEEPASQKCFVESRPHFSHNGCHL